MEVIQKPYVLFLGDAPDQLAAKTANGIARWRPADCVGQMRLSGCAADVGLPDVTLDQAVSLGAKTLVIGVANRGGTFAASWQAVMLDALERGLDIASGLHERVASLTAVAATAERLGRSIHDVRHPTAAFPIATGARRSGRRVLAVGTDCSIGKMFTALAIERELKSRGIDADFRATGQTGILIAGSGVSIDAVVSDFVAGAVETLCPAAPDSHWDVIEGQASLLHPSYAGVTLALVHGGQPDAMILCHEPDRPHMRGLSHRPMPAIEDAIAIHEQCARLTNPAAIVVGIALNTSSLTDAAARDVLAETETRYRLPCGDPMRGGVGVIVDRMLALFP